MKAKMDDLDIDFSMIPEDAKNMSACSKCHYVMENRQWRSIDGCPNCKGERDTLRFQGAVALLTMNDKDSYILRLLRANYNAEPKIPGIYAITLVRRASAEEDE
ncbi:Transcription elongation factor SPT4 [Giardia duodenalis assemblage B]|uniref:Transcription elongation factor SPT4 n=3 Tax=Giardia intestinalis TaxID=5741 RepID=A0A132P1M1_GIAIN|nr:Transcription elongation factor SPT4 [Giardia intestinalis]KWX15882.1 Transcription elongation factor SPT4 [Giardia intestinalis assemblage B]